MKETEIDVSGARLTTVVTGGSGAIGSAVVRRMAAEGHRVINISLEEPSKDLPAETHLVDLTDQDATARVLSDIAVATQVDNLVNNAGFTYVAEIDALSFDRMHAMVDIHLRASLQCIQAFVPAMRKKSRGRVVNIGTRMMLGRPGRTVYGMAKAGLLGATRSLALELAPSGITLNMVSPGPIETSLFRQNHPSDSADSERVVSAIPLGRIGTPCDVAHAVAFFLSDNAGWITGQNLFVCGGGSVGTSAI